MHDAQVGDTVLLILPDRNRLLVNLEPGAAQHTHYGMIQHDDIIGQPLGRTIESHLGKRVVLLKPSMEELLVSVQRATQIIFPKDIGYILLKLSVFPGQRVIEAGTGSGALATALARYVWPGGQLYTYEKRPEFYELSGRNLQRAGLLQAVTRHQREIGEGFDERDVDAVFLDVREPWLYLAQVVEALGPGGFFGCILPTVNQVVSLLHSLPIHPLGDIEIAEIMLRQYKPVAERLRPMDRLTAHTGYLVFARRVVKASPHPPAPSPTRGEGEQDGVGAEEGADSEGEAQ
jgi:tRNA (adenine57-N1/adenine58-N1)-methyltransferase